MIDFTEFDKLKVLNDKNDWFESVFQSYKIECFSETDTYKFLDLCYWLFKENYEENNYRWYKYIAEICEEILSVYLENTSWEAIRSDETKVENILDIICFVYELTYRYIQEAQILEKIADDENVSTKNRIRALEVILQPIPEFISYFSLRRKNYIRLFNELS